MQGWKGKLLSRAGKEVLIKAVAQSIPTYTMGVFLLRAKLCHELNAMCARFWWGQTGDERKIHWKNWGVLCRPKKEGGMGFRDLKNFNLAMLAKQGWRLIQATDSLLYRCFKARYFPRVNFLEASDVPNGSYVWKSLLAAQPILKQGCCWRVGDGSTIRVMSDKWIPNHVTNRILHPPVEEVWEWRVSELIDWRINAWDRELVTSKFQESDAKAILNIPLSRWHVTDVIFWLQTRDGEYSVKSGYHIARLLSKLDDGNEECSGAVIGGSVWARMWKLKLPNKIKVFSWRACLDILPTRVNLARRRIIEDARCGVCFLATETGYHALWECGLAQDIWAGCISSLQKSSIGHDDMLQLVEDFHSRLSNHELEMFWVQCWLIWNQRNSLLHGSVIQDPDRLNQRARDYLEEFRATQAQLGIMEATGSVQLWRPPSGSVYKLNFDVAIFTDLSATGFGVVIRNNRGEVMAALAAKGPAVADSEEAEVLACRRALEFAVDASFRELEVEGDNDTVMRTLGSLHASRSRLGNIYGDIWVLAAGCGCLSFQCVKRSANTVAHSLARFARLIDDDICWMEENPPPAVEALYMDSISSNV